DMNEKKVTLQVVVSQKLADRVDYYANYMGMSRSGLCASIIGQGILGYDKAGNILEKYIVDEMSKKEAID
ncbi:MAG: hypothetical protein GX365_02785, partial [Clostridiales bacterium]|nr:hypothetical protein [Clostridiales bacterium]